LSARNLDRYEVVSETEATTYNILNAQHLVIEENAVVKLESILA
jgi:ribosomal protein L4